jgi:hypothetical protein
VFQEHDDGCGIACVAMLAGISYGEACRTIFDDAEGDAASFEDLRWALMAHGLRVPKRMTPFWEGWYTQLRQPALLAINPMANGMWHWAVWEGANRFNGQELRVRKGGLTGREVAENLLSELVAPEAIADVVTLALADRDTGPA